MKNIRLIALLIFTCTTLCEADITSGLVGEWLFNGNANDSSGNGLNGVVSGATLTTDHNGIQNEAYSFDGRTSGTGNWISIPNSGAILSTLTQWTIETRVRIDGFSGIGPQRLVSFEGADFTGAKGFALGYSTSDMTHVDNFYMGASYGGSPDPSVNSTFQPNLGQWYQVVGTYDGTTAKLYIDGVLNNQLIADWTLTSTQDLQFGRFLGSTNPPGYTGDANAAMDEVRIYDHALTASDVSALNVVPEPSTGLLIIIGSAIGLFRRHRKKCLFE